MQAGPANEDIERIQFCLYWRVTPQQHQDDKNHVRRPGQREVAFVVMNFRRRQMSEIEFVARFPDLDEYEKRCHGGNRSENIGEFRTDEIRNRELCPGERDSAYGRCRQDTPQTCPATHHCDHVGRNEQRNRSANAADAGAQPV